MKEKSRASTHIHKRVHPFKAPIIFQNNPHKGYRKVGHGGSHGVVGILVVPIELIGRFPIGLSEGLLKRDSTPLNATKAMPPSNLSDGVVVHRTRRTIPSRLSSGFFPLQSGCIQCFSQIHCILRILMGPLQWSHLLCLKLPGFHAVAIVVGLSL